MTFRFTMWDLFSMAVEAYWKRVLLVLAMFASLALLAHSFG